MRFRLIVLIANHESPLKLGVYVGDMWLEGAYAAPCHQLYSARVEKAYSHDIYQQDAHTLWQHNELYFHANGLAVDTCLPSLI